MTEPTKEQINNNVESTWRKDFYSTNWKQIQGDSLYLEKVDFYIEARRKAQEEIKQLEQELKKTRDQLEKCENSLMKVACFETHGENKYINHEQAYTGVANFARQYFQDKDKQSEG